MKQSRRNALKAGAAIAAATALPRFAISLDAAPNLDCIGA